MLAVFGERLSGFKFPVKRENTGKLTSVAAKAKDGSVFDYKSSWLRQNSLRI